MSDASDPRHANPDPAKRHQAAEVASGSPPMGSKPRPAAPPLAPRREACHLCAGSLIVNHGDGGYGPCPTCDGGPPLEEAAVPPRAAPRMASPAEHESTTELTTTTPYAGARAAILSRLRVVEAAEEMWQQATYLAVEKMPCRECGGSGVIDGGSLGSICPECLGSRAEALAGQAPPPPPALRSMRAQLLDAHKQVFNWHLAPQGEMPTPALPPWSAIEEVLEGAAKAAPKLGDGWRKLLPPPRIVENSSLDDLEPDLDGDSEDAKVVLEAMGGSVLPVVFDDGSAIVCSRLAGGARGDPPVDLHLTFRRPGREDVTHRYSRAVEYTDGLLAKLEKLYQSYGNQDTPDDWRALQRDVGELLRAAGWEINAEVWP